MEINSPSAPAEMTLANRSFDQLNWARNDWRSAVAVNSNDLLFAIIFHRLACPPTQGGVEEPLDVAVHYRVEVALAILCAGVLHPLVGVQEVVADLRAEARLRLLLILRRLG